MHMRLNSQFKLHASVKSKPFTGVSLRGCPPRRVHHLRGISPIAGVGSYISEAFARIFSVADDEEVEWDKVSAPFTGRITHREATQLRRLYDVVQATKGCTDIGAANYDPSANVDDGSCVYEPGKTPTDLKNYLGGAVERVFGNQFKGDDTEPAEFPLTSFSGEIKSQREIERMLQFEKVVKKTLDEADVKPAEN
eukprot:g2687.t1